MTPGSAGTTRIRSFVAIDVTGAARDAVVAFLDRLRATGADVAWSRPDALHVTLKFLGSVDPERLARLGAALDAAVREQAAFTLTLRGVGAFPSLGRPTVLWIGVDAPELAALAARVDDAARAEGFAPEARVFHPHLTLGRIRDDRRRRRGGALPAERRGALEAERTTVFGVVEIADVILFRSDLGARGARHTPLVRFPLHRCDA